MPEFIADTAGTVHGLTWDDLNKFTQGYIEAMLFTETSPVYSMCEWFEPEAQAAIEDELPGDAGFGDLHPDAFAEIQSDCIAFEHKAAELLAAAYQQGYTPDQAGRDFWFTRNGHGCGFWDRKELETPGLWEAHGSPRVDEPGWAAYIAEQDNSLGRKLTDIAEEFGQVWAHFGEGEGSPTGYGYIYMG